MLITSREKSIIDLIIKTSGKHSPASLASFLGVSVRTIQRDLKSVEKILEEFGLSLRRKTEEGLAIDGQDEKIFRLIQFLLGIHTVDQTPEERSLKLLLALLQESETYKLQGLAVELGISIATLTAALDEMTYFLKGYHIELTRKRGVGIEVKGSEADKRKALASYYLIHFNYELIEALFIMTEDTCSEEKILQFFKPEYLLEIDRLVSTIVNTGPSRLADSDYVGLIVQLAITMQRTESGFLLAQEGQSNESLVDEMRLIQKISEEIEAKFRIPFTEEDKFYLAVILKGSKLQDPNMIPYGSVVLGRKIKSLIEDVSAQLHEDLTRDFSLYQGLLAHMEPSLFRLKQKMELYNPLAEEIKHNYSVLFMAVKNSLGMHFSEFDFPDDEIAFIVLHFGSSLVMNEETVSIRALLVCPTGIGTSKMLASRVKKEVQEITAVDIKSIREIGKKESLASYDLIISTVRLPILGIDYILVSTLLNDEDISAIRSYLGRNVEKLTRNKNIHPIQPAEKKPKKELSEIMQDITDVQRSINQIIGNFRLFRINEPSGRREIMKRMLEEDQDKALLSDITGILEALMDREEKGGLGIPESAMGLYHCRHPEIKSLIFQIAHLQEPIDIRGMDGSMIKMKNLLLMLAPEDLNEREQELISLISTSLIESREAMMIYSSSNEESIRIRLEELFLDYLHHNLIKE
ncbi:BglG family transcription antiterminator [Peribacillus kribbensis]|uniref:BglG family transcription antiterminator n=1 Tax=Peribacillus kribbensis TaxID=356658 RepID=UPI0004073EB6|nr:PRD domain-containing protein [Peribacillus kribbensis]